jgi:hypothetical protein
VPLGRELDGPEPAACGAEDCRLGTPALGFVDGHRDGSLAARSRVCPGLPGPGRAAGEIDQADCDDGLAADDPAEQGAADGLWADGPGPGDRYRGVLVADVVPGGVRAVGEKVAAAQREPVPGEDLARFVATQALVIWVIGLPQDSHGVAVHERASAENGRDRLRQHHGAQRSGATGVPDRGIDGKRVALPCCLTSAPAEQALQMAPFPIGRPYLDVAESRRRRSGETSWHAVHLVEAQDVAGTGRPHGTDERGITSLEADRVTAGVEADSRVSVGVEVEAVEAEGVCRGAVILQPVPLPLRASRVSDQEQVAERLRPAVAAVQQPVLVLFGEGRVDRADRRIRLGYCAEVADAADQPGQALARDRPAERVQPGLR